jgi:hypothetical protein
MSMRAKHRAIGQKPTQRKGHPGGGSMMSLDASCGTADNVGYTPVTVDDSLRLRADELDAEAAYYRRRVIQEQQTLARVTTSICSGPWRLIEPRWHSGSGPERPQHHQRPANPARPRPA